MTRNQTPIVFDFGSTAFRVGFAGDDAPKYKFPSLVGRAKIQEPGQQDVYVGDEAQSRREILDVKNPIVHGAITDWDDMEKVWRYALYNKLQISPEQHPVLLTESPVSPPADREKMAQIMFENFNVPEMYVSIQSVLSLHASGRTTGVVVDIKDLDAYIVPVYEGYALSHIERRFGVTGSDLTDHVKEILIQRGFSFATANREIVEDIKEKLCYVANNFEHEVKVSSTTKHHEKLYKLPDGRHVTIGEERFRGPEILFKPSFMGKDSLGIQEATYYAVRKADEELHRNLYANILLSGGTTLFPGFVGRLKQEIVHLAPSMMDVDIIAPKQRIYSSWVGGSMLASQSNFQGMWITKKEYDEVGPRIVRYKIM